VNIIEFFGGFHVKLRKIEIMSRVLFWRSCKKVGVLKIMLFIVNPCGDCCTYGGRYEVSHDYGSLM
jgi:hypothetical protein